MTSINLKTKHINETVVVRKATYPNGSTALVLSSPIGEPMGHATVALEELPGAGNIFIKDWNENAGLLGALQQLGIVGPVIRTVPSGFCEAHEVELLTEIDSPPLRECEVCGAMSALNFCAACGCAQLRTDSES